MRIFVLMIATVSALAGASIFGTPAQAMSCSARHAVCIKFCGDTYKGTQTKCSTNCSEALPVCQASGCWKTPMSSKCGYTKG